MSLAKRLTLKCRAPTKRRDGKPCRLPCGWKTTHPGFGPCKVHDRRHTKEAWNMALDVARELNVSPWDALLLAVRKSAGRVAWVDQQLSDATRAADGDMNDRAVSRWLDESRRERSLMARTAKAAVDAGVAERYVRHVELEGRLVAEVLGRVIDRLELSSDARLQAFAVAQEELLVLEPAELEGPTA